jgi:hypothetical protein
MSHGYALALSKGIGIVQISEFALVEAVMDGIPKPPTTRGQMPSWSQVKQRER